MIRSFVKKLPGAVRAVGIASISIVAMFFAACNMNPALAGLDDANARNGSGSGSGTTPTAVIDLGAAASFAVLGGTTVTNAAAPVSVITGDLGVSPGTAITGFSSPPNTFSGPGTVTPGTGTVSGTIYAGGPVAALAHNDAALAYAELLLQVAPPANSHAGVTPLESLGGFDLSGNPLPLSPGVYDFAPAAILNAGMTLTLDFGNDPNAVFIFKVGTTLTANVNSKIVAINTGGSPTPNVYWAVGSSATINGASFIGTVIAVTTITMTSNGNIDPIGNPINSSVAGRMLALGGAVTMVGDTISVVAGSGTGGGDTGGGDTGGGGHDHHGKNKDYITGGGWIGGEKHKDKDKDTFAISGGIKNGAFWGKFSFNNHEKKNEVKVKSTQITGYFVIDATTRRIEGVAKLNKHDVVTFTVIVSDNGNKRGHGRDSLDTFELHLYNNAGVEVYTVEEDTLSGGNIRLHKEGWPRWDRHDRALQDQAGETYVDQDELDGISAFDQ